MRFFEKTSNELENRLRKTRILEVNFWIPVVWILVIFLYVVADVILYSKSLGSAGTVKFWLRTSSQCGTPAGMSSCPYSLLPMFGQSRQNGGSCLSSIIVLIPEFQPFRCKSCRVIQKQNVVQTLQTPCIRDEAFISQSMKYQKVSSKIDLFGDF